MPKGGKRASRTARVMRDMETASKPGRAYRLASVQDPTTLETSKSGRYLSAIRRDMDLKGRLFQQRKRNEEVLALAYQDGTMLGGEGEVENLRQNAHNLPYRFVRWMEAQATSKELVVKVGRDAGAGQLPGGPADAVVGQYVGLALKKAAYAAGFVREAKALIAETLARGVSVIGIGYHRDVITVSEAREAGKDAQSVAPEVMQAAADVEAGMEPDPSALEAKPGQADAEIADGLKTMAGDEMVQKTAGSLAVNALLARAAAHDKAALANEADSESPISSTRMIRHRLYMRKLRVGSQVGWDPRVSDAEDAAYWWQRFEWTVAEVKASDLFKPEFKAVVKGMSGWNESGVASGGQMPDVENMGSDARQAQTEMVLDDDERVVEWFAIWIRRPDMRSGGIRKIVCAEWPEQFCEADESNPHVFEGIHPSIDGLPSIEGFYPFFDFAPVLSSLPVPERTTGVPPVAVGMPQFEQMAESNRLVHEAALRSVRLDQLHPGLKDNKDVLKAIQNGTPIAFVAPPSLVDSTGKMQEGVLRIQFTGEAPEVERYSALMRGQWIEVMGMPPAVLQGQGTAETLGQDEMGVAAGERESGALVACFEYRFADVFKGLRGLMRGCLDDEDFIDMLGAEGGKALKAWQTGTKDIGDEVTVTFGARAQAQKAVERKQLMEAITLIRASVDPLTGLPIYDEKPLVEELFRTLDVGAPPMNATMLSQLQQMVVQLAAMVQQATGVNPLGGAGGAGGGGGAPPNGKAPSNQDGDKRTKPGPNPSEGDGPSSQNIGAGAERGTLTATY